VQGSIPQDESFVILPAHTPLPDGTEGKLDGSALSDGLLYALGRKSISRRPAIRSGQRTLRIISYNIHSCVGLDGKLSPNRIARIIRGFNPDIVALQEVDIKRQRSRGEDQSARLARELEMEVAFCCTMNRASEKYGHALLTRFPVEVIASGLFRAGQEHPEPRGVLLAKAKWAGSELYLANTHFGLGTAECLEQMQTFLGSEWLGRVPADAPLIVCGDFNMTPASSAYGLMLDRFTDTQLVSGRKPLATFPSPLPISRIDFVFVSKHFEVMDTKVPRNSLTRVASDHLPLVVDLNCG
jgi:endonuclease/exonuclease/phosphatase family metal-dependent hydrolase